MQSVAELRDVATAQQTAGTTADADHQSRHRIALRHPAAIERRHAFAFGQRRVVQYFTQLNAYHVILEVLPELRGKHDALDKLYV
jgi:HAE1 family hydrophobic/amphiphilic exporter-1